MGDIVERLRLCGVMEDSASSGLDNDRSMYHAAADEIERLREALEEICDRDKFVACGPGGLLAIARAALKGDE